MKKMGLIDQETSNLNDKIFDDFRFDRSTDRTVTQIGKIRAEIRDKRPTKYTIVKTISVVLSDMKTWKNETLLHELKFLSDFESLAVLLLEDTGVNANGGEGISQATRRKAIINEYDLAFGRRCDSLVQGNNGNELANIEFKRANVSTVQQTKNIRMNGCILNDINLMTDSNDNTILYFDFVGRYGYLAQLFVFEDAYACQKYTALVTPANMLQLDFFRPCLKTCLSGSPI